ncbi:MAG: hypothetical protein CMC96_12425 [Flavobacteriales bacterium]|nr:hypothetical protein [Flavobacteriales bacterium]|tara:strand:- start:2672 stop:3277 length:606 start_codon:yes stop_codon:yes gene_type:complete
MKKDELIDRILNVMRKKGAQVIRMNQLSIETQVNSKVLREHFSTKEEVFEAGIRKVLNNHKVATKLVKADETLHPIVKVARIYKIVLTELMQYHPSFFFHIQKHYRKLYQQIENYNNLLFEQEIPALLHQAKSQGIIISQINLDLFSKVQLSESQLLIENIYPAYLDKKEELIGVLLTRLRGLLKKEYFHLLDKEIASIDK